MQFHKTLTIASLIILLGCQTQKKMDYSPYLFKINSYPWDIKPYKFKSFIRDSVLIDKGREFAAWDYSYIGDIESMLKTWDNDQNSKEPLPEEKKALFAQYQPQLAIPHVVQKAKNYQVTVINEAHQMPQHRVFTTRLLEDFYALAYPEGEEIGSAVPYDIQESANKKVNLVLEPQTYNVIIWNYLKEALLVKQIVE